MSGLSYAEYIWLDGSLPIQGIRTQVRAALRRRLF